MAAKVARYFGVLGVCMAVSAAAAGGVFASRYGDGSYLASGVAAGLIWVLGGLSLACIAVPQSRHGRLNGALLGMLIRMSLPLAALVYFNQAGGALAASGIATFIVIHYLVGLVIETLLCVRLVTFADKLGAAAAA